MLLALFFLQLCYVSYLSHIWVAHTVIVCHRTCNFMAASRWYGCARIERNRQTVWNVLYVLLRSTTSKWMHEWKKIRWLFDELFLHLFFFLTDFVASVLLLCFEKKIDCRIFIFQRLLLYNIFMKPHTFPRYSLWYYCSRCPLLLTSSSRHYYFKFTLLSYRWSSCSFTLLSFLARPKLVLQNGNNKGQYSIS